MIFLLNLIFVVAFLLVIYHFLVFPALLLLSAAFRQSFEPEGFKEENLPTVAMLISARNEEKCIEEKLKNSLEIDYPEDKIRIIVLANGCTDNTEEIVKGYAGKGIECFEYGNIGKGLAQNEGVKAVDSEIIVFSDANTPYNTESIRNLVKPFSDKTVGSVCGRHLYVNLEESTGATEGSYWSLVENNLKKAEDKTGGVIGANGAIYAIRRDLYIPLPPGITDDMFGPLLIAAEGFRTVYAPMAIAHEKAEKTFADEYKRKELVVQRTVYSLLFAYPWLLNPMLTGRIAILLWSHKVLRWFSPPLMALILLISFIRVVTGNSKGIDLPLLIGSSLFGFAAILGRGLGDEKPIPVVTFAYYLFLMFKAATLGMYKAFVHGSVVVWDHSR